MGYKNKEIKVMGSQTIKKLIYNILIIKLKVV